ncbi:pyruvate dehydrogenase (acetyl-transferring) E1 component subunit alpha [Rubricoccus marinus]|uniref:Pyruvate dehydrogenase E1 component subunit alpha n=1 Tax=Rubricoccus marinus TaxID=716817 RepID=A0A259TZS6_9BACT|nr:pyruvate dehydrogenase (acetyl-transferring) E1 component subunit alpha [Rubricoccus marinus]OZC03064.1 pyruvate dehydrogenase (acetyl-transferring) E1 component subunit alpha [Rubricoccus marinus]
MASTQAPEAPSPNGTAIPDVPTPDVRFFRNSGHTHESLGLSADDVTAMYRNMLLQRRFEERAAQMYGRQKISGFLHLYIGQEAVSTGAVWGTRPDDPIITAYRDHGLALARGMDTGAGMAELFGKIDGCSRGKGGSMHFFDIDKSFYGGHGIVGGQIPVGVGLGFACKYKKTGGVAMAFFGDGAINQGAFHEAANLAALYKVPVLLIVENNEYAMGTSVERSRGDANLWKSGYPYGMKSVVIDGMDLFEVYHAFKTIADEARGESAGGDGAPGETHPIFVEVQTYRYRGHSMSDPQKYRTKEEMEGKKNEDPIVRIKQYMLEHELSTIEALDEIDESVKAEVMQAVEFAENSPFPPEETMYEDVYVQKDYPFIS